MADVDLLVAGAGGGLAGALRAAQHGLDVVVAEANPHFRRGNNTAMSTAMVPGPGSRFQRAAGLEDSPERFLADVAAKTGGRADPAVAGTLAHVGAELVAWLADDVGLPLALAEVDYPGHSVRRCHTVPGHSGAALLGGLVSAAASRVDLLVPARVVSVARSGDGWRVVLGRPDGAEEELHARGVLLATSGYGADPAMVAEHLPEIAGAAYHGSEYATGDALRLGAPLGAATRALDAYQGHAGLSAAARTLVTWTTVMAGAVVVDADGRRFGDETVGYSEYAARLAARPGARGWLVLDARIDAAARAFDDYRDVVDAGAVRWAPDPESLAARLGLPGDALVTELAATTLQPPLGAVEIVPALFHTQGGLAVDADARVLGPDGVPLGTLYASGGAAVGMSGHGAAGYLAGNGLLPALGLAYRAADHLADHLADRPAAQETS